ncbi:coiled-coil domain-containing protein 103 [Rhineura floridana]|uniref:coiled-coil domain-containing protein 103 n=1 Tax=Rhineura floridana TaxID=261503 RepID=UPI002AC8604B|nr:coiled-coil domain-containing protein 103 [Rhineura floridana]XP_061444711.1 coiled-coil domain-containing protein 103 [Rhineura floridana]XP_061444712.1 coiled-coil domain-containing protein 103 [Rhineura floridana]XP_061444713.1 coiled-coil domain-containing protein 103 [Rhineura floridana]XP_061444714.1 coiled-coil domain-containing protein 103 [Rhineura floridana]
MEGAIDIRALEKELEGAIAADEKYLRENEAKFRAVHQKVASYEEFRDIVLASHLKPLEKKDKMGNKRNVLWNSCAMKASCKQENKVELSQKLERLPETSAEFYRDWRRCMKNSQERYQLLLQLGSQNLGRIFQTDLAFGLLGEFLAVFTENVCIKDRDYVLEILESFSDTKRFGLNVELLGEQEKENCQQLFEKLQRMGTDPSSPPEEGMPVAQIHCQADGPDERKLIELMHLYQVS